MSEMIERVAMAIRRNKFERNGRASVFDPSNISEEELGEARAAIEAMREPTEATWRAVDKAIHREWPNAKKMAVAVHEAIVDASLSEKP